MHQSSAGVTGIGRALQDAYPKGLEPGRLTELDDALVLRAVALGVAVDLLVGQPLGTGAPIATQQSQMSAIRVEASATIGIDRLQAYRDVTSIADLEEQACEFAEVRAPARECSRIETLVSQ